MGADLHPEETLVAKNRIRRRQRERDPRNGQYLRPGTTPPPRHGTEPPARHHRATEPVVGAGVDPAVLQQSAAAFMSLLAQVGQPTTDGDGNTELQRPPVPPPGGLWRGLGRVCRKQRWVLRPWLGALLLAGLAGVVLAAAALDGYPDTTRLVGAILGAGLFAVLVACGGRTLGARWVIPAATTAAVWLTWTVYTGIGWWQALGLWWLTLAAGWRWWRRHRFPYPTEDPMLTKMPQRDETAATAAEIMHRWNSRVAAQGGQMPGSPIALSVAGQDHEDGVQAIAFDLVLQNITLGDAQSRLARVAVALRCDPRQLVLDQPVRADGGWTDAAAVRLQYIMSSPITSTVDFEQVEHAGGAVILGPYADGRGGAPWQVLTDDGAKHGVLVAGTGNGKSATMMIINMQARAMTPMVTAVFDLKKTGHIDHQRHVSVFASGPEEAERFTTAVEHLAAGLQWQAAYHQWSGYNTVDGWQRSNTTGELVWRPMHMILVDEPNRMWHLDPRLAPRWGHIVQTLRSFGGSVIFATHIDRADVFGGDEVLRSSLCSGNILLMRVDGGQGNGQLIASDLPPAQSLPLSPGYGYLRSPGGRQGAPMRVKFLPRQDQRPDGPNAAQQLALHPDAEMCEIGKAAFADYLHGDLETRGQVNRDEAQRRLNAFLAGDRAQAFGAAGTEPGDVVGAAAPGHGGPAVPTIIDASKPQGGRLTAAQVETLAAISAGNTATPAIAATLGVSESRVRVVLGQLRDIGAVTQHGAGPATRYTITTVHGVNDFANHDGSATS